jgi:phosphoribosylformimino-5-aminoimidazole carboxamide ribotide isomerase
VEIIPAIDVRGGLCVRLAQGDYSRETVYDQDPVAVAQRWEQQGATRLHVVDLDGAREGRPLNRAVILRLLAAVSLSVQVGGGIRTDDDALRYRDAGAERVVLGTAAVEDRGLVRRLAESLGGALLVGIDARDGVAMTRGPNVTSLRAFVEAAGRPVIASGGVSKPEHVVRVARAGAEAVIIGRALYCGDLSLSDALVTAHGANDAHRLHA